MLVACSLGFADRAHGAHGDRAHGTAPTAPLQC